MTSNTDYLNTLGRYYADGLITSEQFIAKTSGPLRFWNVGVSVDDSAWRCHYCGSSVARDLYKCPSCAGDRR